MQRFRFTLKLAVATFCLVVLTAGIARANPIGGTATLAFAGGGGLSGYFEFDPNTNQIASWLFTSTAFGTHVYDSSNTAAGASSIIISNSNNDLVLAFGQNFDERYELDIVINCAGTANCVSFGSPNMAFAIVGGAAPCAPGALKCVPSGEQAVVGVNSKFLTGGFFNLTDPPGTVAFNVDSSIASGFTLYAGGDPTGGGTDTGVPEPASITLLATALCGVIGRNAVRRRNARA